MRFLVAGLGSAGRRHLRNLQALGERDIVLYRTGRSTLPEADLAGLPVETDLGLALAHKPDAVIIANPTALHLDVAIPAARAGCHIFLEKPVSADMDGLDALAETALASGSRILVGFQFRFHPTLRQAAASIAGGAIGQVLTVHVHWGEYLPNWHPWEDYRRSYVARRDLGGGVVRTFTHPLDFIRWLVGDVDALWAFGGHRSPLEIDVEDVAEIGLRFTSGVVGGIHLNLFQRPPRQSLEVVGTQGTMRWDNADGVLHMQRFPAAFGSWSDNPPPPLLETIPPPPGFERNVIFLEQMRHFLAVVRGDVVPACTLTDGILALKLALSALESVHTGKMVSVP